MAGEQIASSSRAPVWWATWKKESASYLMTTDHGAEEVTVDHVIALRKRGAQVTCYGGPLDHRRPTRMREGA